MPHPTYSLMLHGGAGSVGHQTEAQTAIKQIATAGDARLKQGANALDVVEYCVMQLENHPLFNAGHGSVLNHEGEIELDASIMDGRNMQAGAIAGVRGIKNPVQLARAVMEHSEHVMLIGSGAEQFAKHQHLPAAGRDYFLTPHRLKQWEAARAGDHIVLDHTDLAELEKKYGTVGAVARDHHGNLAAATSTGGIVGKKYGRVGDSPIIGAGVYAENDIAAISSTGFGEQFIRTVIAKHAADIIRHTHADAQTAADAAIAYLVEKVQGLGGLIVLDAAGRPGRAYSTPGMIYAVAEADKTPSAHLS